MEFITITLLALGLSADAFAVALTNGICSAKVTKKDAVTTAFTFGLFQTIMPILGYYLGATFFDIIYRFQHWIAFLLLTSIGANMLSEVYHEWKHPEKDSILQDIFTPKKLIMQGIATSIDALAAGVSMVAIQLNIVSAALFIGLITFFCCAVGVFIGKRFGALLGIRARLVGSMVLIILGLKILLEHQFS